MPEETAKDNIIRDFAEADFWAPEEIAALIKRYFPINSELQRSIHKSQFEIVGVSSLVIAAMEKLIDQTINLRERVARLEAEAKS
jgi:hypothetical protein